MRAGFFISFLLHAALLAWSINTIEQTPELMRPESEPIAVAMITPSEFLRMKQGSETAKELEAKAADKPTDVQSKLEAEKPKPVLAPTPPAEPEPPKPAPTPEPPKAAETPPPPPEPPRPDPIAEILAEAPPPPPGPTPDELKKAEYEKKAAEEAQKKAAEEKNKADEKKKAEQKKKAEAAKKKAAEAKRKKEEEEKKKQASVADRMAALLDKDPTKKGAPASASEPTTPTDYRGPTAGTATGNDTVLSVREQDLLRGMLRAQIARCWRLPGAGGGTETPIVTLRWKMRKDGTLEADPRVEKPASGPLAALATESALRAVKGCQPYDLPPDLFESGWQEIIWEFDPTDML